MTESPGVLFERLLDVMARLRGPAGCPWDREQTRASLKPYLIEEAYEVLEAIEIGHPAELQEELGDLLFQVVFHTRLAEEVSEFAMRDVLERLITKMVVRHPHVLGDASFSLVNVARLSSIDAEEALQGAIEKFRRRFAGMEADLSAQGKSVGAVPQDEMERSWESTKAHERRRAKP